jgi:hypothetical protein
LVVGATLAAVGLAIGCSSGSGSVLKGDPTTIVRRAADRTLATGSAKVDVTLGVATGPGLAGGGLVDFAHQHSDVTLQRTGSAAKTNDRFELVIDGTFAFLGGVTPAIAGKTTFISGQLTDVARAAHDRMTPLDNLMVRPGAGLDLALLRGAQDVLPYGGEEIQGASTFRYSLVVNLALASANSPPADRPALDAANAAIGGVLEPADVWLDQSGRVRQLQMASNPKLHTTTTKANLLGITEDGEYLSFIVIDFSRFGLPAVVTIPSLPGA